MTARPETTVPRRSCLATGVALLLALALPAPSPQAAETFHACTGFIDTLPATISTQGTWCLRQDLATAISSGQAISIATNNVTIDCNHFKIGGLAAGAASQAIGIGASGRQNASVRNCNLRGFFTGIQVDGGAGHLIQGNQFDNIYLSAIVLLGENSIIRRNRIHGTGGGTPVFVPASGIFTNADVIGNVITDVIAGAPGGEVYGIWALGASTTIRDNHVSYLVPGAGSAAYGIAASGAAQRVAGNHLVGMPDTDGTGIDATGTLSTCSGNTVSRFATALSGCEANAGNLSSP